MGKAGDGQKSGFEGSFWNWTRSDEKNALVAQDRASEAQAKAIYKAELADGDNVITAGEHMPPGQTVTSMGPPGAQREVVDRRGRKGMRRLANALKAQHDLNELYGKRLGELEDNFEGLAKELHNREEMTGNYLDRFLSLSTAAIEVINVGDRPQSVMALQLARIIQAWEVVGNGNASRAMKLVANLLVVYAYYDPRKGFASLFTTDATSFRPSGSGTIAGLLGGLSSTPAGSGAGAVSL